MQSQRRFTDIEGQIKESRILKDSKGRTYEGHSGNSNYISAEFGMVHHNTGKIVKKTKHICKFNKYM